MGKWMGGCVGEWLAEVGAGGVSWTEARAGSGEPPRPHTQQGGARGAAPCHTSPPDLCLRRVQELMRGLWGGGAFKQKEVDAGAPPLCLCLFTFVVW